MLDRKANINGLTKDLTTASTLGSNFAYHVCNSMLMHIHCIRAIFKAIYYVSLCCVIKPVTSFRKIKDLSHI